MSTLARLSEVRAMAGWLAARGVPVFPCLPGGKTPASAHGFKDASADPATVAAWWQQTPYNVGIATGPAGLVVLDLDTPKPGKPLPAEWASVPGVVDGADVLAVLAERAGQPYPADTRTVATPSGGLHLYFTHPGPPFPQLRCTTGGRPGSVGPLIDTRTHGGYVVAPPSRAGGGTYRTINPGPVAPLPHWLAAALAPDTRSQEPRTTRLPVSAAGRDLASDRYALAAFAGEVDAVLAAAPGTRNDALNRAAHALGSLVAAARLDARQVVDALTIAADHIGLPPREAARTIASGLSAGAANPRPSTSPSGRTA